MLSLVVILWLHIHCHDITSCLRMCGQCAPTQHLRGWQSWQPTVKQYPEIHTERPSLYIPISFSLTLLVSCSLSTYQDTIKLLLDTTCASWNKIASCFHLVRINRYYYYWNTNVYLYNMYLKFCKLIFPHYDERQFFCVPSKTSFWIHFNNVIMFYHFCLSTWVWLNHQVILATLYFMEILLTPLVSWLEYTHAQFQWRNTM